MAVGGLRGGPVSVRVPATSANLGPGFDALGLALTLHDEVTAEVLDGPPGTLSVEVLGEGAEDVPRDHTHLVYRAMVRGFAELGMEVPAVALRCHNAIPHGRGLGSSSAAIVAGLGVARALVEDGPARWPDRELFAVAADLEGHPDNVAPAVFGALTVAYADKGTFRALRLEVLADPALVLYVPPEPLPTTVARGLLPATVPHADAAWNAGRAALLVAALCGGAPDLREHLLAATEDRLHQAYRAPAMPRSAALMARLREDGVPAVVSGAGPTVLAVTVPQHVPDLAARAPAGWRVLELRVARHGLEGG